MNLPSPADTVGSTCPAVPCTREWVRSDDPAVPEREVWHAIDGPVPEEGDAHLLLCGGGDAIGLPTTPGMTMVPTCPACVDILTGTAARPPHHDEVTVTLTPTPPDAGPRRYTVECDCGWAVMATPGTGGPKAAATTVARHHLWDVHHRRGRDAAAAIQTRPAP